jgi:hypothetical protein
VTVRKSAAPPDLDAIPGEPMAHLLDDLQAALQVFRTGKRRDGWVSDITATVRLLETFRAHVSPESAAQLSELALPLVLLAEVLASLSLERAAQLEQSPVIRRMQHAIAAGCVEALVRTGWTRHEAGEYVGSIVGVATETAVSWRDSLAGEPPTTFAQQEAETAAALARGVSEQSAFRKQLTSQAIYHEWLAMVAHDDRDTLLQRIARVLATFGVSQAASEIIHETSEGDGS